MNATARELVLFIDNDGDLHRQQHVPIRKNLMVKHAQGKYNRALAVKLFMYLVDNGAKKYAKEHGSADMPWHKMFSKPARTKAAEMLRDQFEDEAKDGEWDEYIPKKYKGVSGKTLGEGTEVPEDGPIFDDDTRKALAKASGGLSEAAFSKGDTVRITKGKMKGLKGTVTHVGSGPQGDKVSVSVNHPVHRMMGPAIVDPKILVKEDVDDLGEAELPVPAIRRLGVVIASMEKQLAQAKSSLEKVKASPQGMAPQVGNIQSAFQKIATLAKAGARRIERY